MKPVFISHKSFVGEIRLKINMFSANKTPLYKACAELLAIILHDVTTETCYLASVCEIGNQIEATDVGFTIRVHGFDDKLLELVVSPSFLKHIYFECEQV